MSEYSSTPGIFQNRFIQAIVMSAIFLQIGIWVRNFAILLYVMEKTNNNAFAVSLISLAEFAPIFLFSIIGGTFADRWLPKRTMIWSDLLSALSVFLVLLVVIFGRWQAIFFVTFVSAILSQFSQPSAMKLFKVHLSPEKMQTGMAMFQTIMAIFMIIGPILGTFLFQRLGISFSIGVTGLSFLLSASALAFIPPDKQDTNKGSGTEFWHELTDGFRYVWSNKALKTLGGTFFIAGLAVGIIQPLGVFIVVERLGLPKENLQWLMSVNGAAMLIGGVLVMGLAKRISPHMLLALGMLASSISVAGIGLSTSLILTLTLQFLNGLFFPCIHIGVNTLILQKTEAEFIGRVNGVLTPLFMGAMASTMILAGWFKAKYSLVSMYELSGFLFFVGMLLMATLTSEKKASI